MAWPLLFDRAMAVALAFDPSELLPESPEPPPTLGAYAVLDRLAEGGMASIFRGRDTATGEMVALKTVRTATPREIAGLEREIDMLRRLSHPGVVRFVAAGRWNHTPWMAVELLKGQTLFAEIASMWRGQRRQRREDTQRTWTASEVITDEPVATDRVADRVASWVDRLQADEALAGPRRPAAGGRLRDAVSLVVRLARVLDYVHGRGVVHRDLKPENVFLGHDGRVTLLDFGLSCRTRRRTLAGEAKKKRFATVEYAAPELLCGERVDARTDIYALGCILYELTTGVRPFDGESPRQTIHMHLDQEPVCPSDRVSGLSWRMEDEILGMLAKRPKHRPRSAAEVAGRLTEAYYDGVAAEARA